MVLHAVEQYAATSQIGCEKFYRSKTSVFQYKKFRQALRCNILHHLTGESYRAFSIRLADSDLFQWFTSINTWSNHNEISKSTLERYEKYFDEKFVAEKIRELLTNLTYANKAIKFGTHQPIDCTNVFMDTSCIKSNIHFPVDWILLRDATRSVLSAIKIIRAQGLKQRMIEPHLLSKQMNKLCITMTHARRKADGKKQRKVIFRLMKKLSSCIAKHGKRYRELLASEWEKTDWTRAQTQQVLNRIDSILEQLPAAVKQAHERIIGERMIASVDKILSLYDKDAHVIVRGKAGNEVEFGQGLLLAEQKDGVIIDWEFFSEQPPADSRLLEPALARMEKHYGPIKSACADRGFDSANNAAFLQQHDTYNAICPKSPKELQKKLSDPFFISLQTRRSQTEARIGIFKNVFLGNPVRSRITAYKRLAVNWCVLTHNLWLLARRAIEYERMALEKVA